MECLLSMLDFGEIDHIITAPHCIWKLQTDVLFCSNMFENYPFEIMGTFPNNWSKQVMLRQVETITMHSNFPEVHFSGSNLKQVTIGSDKGLASNRQQAIIWTNDGLVKWKMHEFASVFYNKINMKMLTSSETSVIIQLKFLILTAKSVTSLPLIFILATCLWNGDCAPSRRNGDWAPSRLNGDWDLLKGDWDLRNGDWAPSLLAAMVTLAGSVFSRIIYKQAHRINILSLFELSPLSWD